MTPARRLWGVVETIHAVTYFAEESRHEANHLGLRGFWRMYFAFRAAPLGRATRGAVEAAFFGFAPAMVSRAVPGIWDIVAPERCVTARADAAAAALRRVAPQIAGLADDDHVVQSCQIPFRPGSGLPLYTANRDVPDPDEPVARLWQRTTLLREHRGDVHNALWTARGMTGVEVLALVAAEHGHRDQLQPNRGWSDEEWKGAERALESRSLLQDHKLTPLGRDLIADVEAATDALALAALTHLAPPEVDRLTDLLRPVAQRVATSGVLPYPNPIGLDPLPTR